MKGKRVSPEQRRKAFKPTLFFGYGSLIRKEGINGKGMRHRYTDEELTTAVLHHYRRSMCGYWGGRNFYGVMEEKGARCNGVIFKIHSWDDYRTLLISEGGTSSYRHTRVYWPEDICDKITGFVIPKNHRVITLVCKNDGTGKGRIPTSYIRLCWMFAQRWGEDFAHEFLQSGGMKYDKNKLLRLRKEGKLNIW